MNTPLEDILLVLNTLKTDDIVFTDNSIPTSFAKLGVIQASIDFSDSWNITKIDDVLYIDSELTSKQIYYCGLQAYRFFAIKEHAKYAQKAVNFKTINFAISGLTERSKEIKSIIDRCEELIKATYASITGISMGKSTLMEGSDTYETYSEDDFSYSTD